MSSIFLVTNNEYKKMRAIAERFSSNDESKHILCSLHIERHTENALRCVATDGYVIGMIDIQTNGTIDEDMQPFCIPTNVMKAYNPKKIAKYVQFEIFDGTEFTIRGIGEYGICGSKQQGTFPDYKKVMPEGNPSKVKYIGLNPRLVNKFYLPWVSLTRFEFHGVYAPIVVYGDNVLIGAIMPQRDTASSSDERLKDAPEEINIADYENLKKEVDGLKVKEAELNKIKPEYERIKSFLKGINNEK